METTPMELIRRKIGAKTMDADKANPQASRRAYTNAECEKCGAQAWLEPWDGTSVNRYKCEKCAHITAD